MDDGQKAALEAYSQGEMAALELRRRLGGATYGEILRLLGGAGLPLPRAVDGREDQIRRAREWMFPKHATIPHFRQPDLGERAAVEVIEEPDRLMGDERGILLCEETTVLKRVVVRDRERIVEISTLDFLGILEAEQRIRSAEAVFALAEQAGRVASRAEQMNAYDERTRIAIRQGELTGP